MVMNHCAVSTGRSVNQRSRHELIPKEEKGLRGWEFLFKRKALDAPLYLDCMSLGWFRMWRDGVFERLTFPNCLLLFPCLVLLVRECDCWLSPNISENSWVWTTVLGVNIGVCPVLFGPPKSFVSKPDSALESLGQVGKVRFAGSTPDCPN